MSQYLDKKLVQEMKSEIEDMVFTDEIGPFIDTLADLQTDKDIIESCIGGDSDE